MRIEWVADIVSGVTRMMVESLSSAEKWVEFRRQMPVTGRWAYFDHAAVAPLPGRPAMHWSAMPSRRPTRGIPSGQRGTAGWKRCDLGARLVGAHAEEIALVRNTTEGISLVAEGFGWQEGNNVVTLDNEFPSNLYPWLNLASRGSKRGAWRPMEAGSISTG